MSLNDGDNPDGFNKVGTVGTELIDYTEKKLSQPFSEALDQHAQSLKKESNDEKSQQNDMSTQEINEIEKNDDPSNPT